MREKITTEPDASQIDIFPYFMVRIAGLAFDVIAGLELGVAARIAEEIVFRRRALEEHKKQVSDCLFDEIGACSDSAIRLKLLRLRRDVFNDRTTPPETVELLGQHADVRTRAIIADHFELCEAVRQLLTDGERIFRDQVEAGRRELRLIAAGWNFQNGLLFSSMPLLTNINRYYIDATQDGFGKREMDTEQGILKYLSRVCTKTSPFSTFTAVAHGLFARDNDHNAYDLKVPAADGSLPVSTVIRLNSRLLVPINRLLRKSPSARLHLPLRVNPSLRLEDDIYVLLQNEHNIETFRRLPRSEGVELLCEQVARDGLTINGLERLILQEGLAEATLAETRMFIDELIRTGIFEFDIGISSNDPEWDTRLRSVLAGLPSDIAIVVELREALERLEGIRSKLDTLSVCECQTLIQEAFSLTSRIDRLASALDSDSDFAGGDPSPVPKKDEFVPEVRFRPESVFFEDARADIEVTLSAEALREAMATLARIVASMTPFADSLVENQRLAEFFRWQYPGKKNVPLLSFYEDYSRLTKLAVSSRAEGQTGRIKFPWSAADTTQVDELAKVWKREFRSLIANSSVESGILDVRSIDVESATISAAGDNKFDLTSRSFAAFLQLLPPSPAGGQFQAVLTNAFTGYGRMFSRFLHLFPAEVTAEIRKNNAELAGSDVFAENCDAAITNVNAHPWPMDSEIWMPNGQYIRPAGKRISLKDVDIRLASECSVELAERISGKTVFVFDLSFQTPRERSRLFNLLRRLCTRHQAAIDLIASSLNEIYESRAPIDNDTQILPRIVFDGRLVLQRKTWLLPKEKVPRRRSGESDWRYYVRVRDWQLRYGLPDDVFICVVDGLVVNDLSVQQVQALKEDDHKPQYLSFRNYFLVTRLEKALSRCPGRLAIREMLPDPSQMLHSRGNRWATEFLVQWRHTDETHC